MPNLTFDRTSFSNRLAEAMHASELSERRLARQAGLSRSTVRAWVSGASSPRLEGLYELAAVLETDVPWLLFGDGADATTNDDSGVELDRLRDGLKAIAADAERLATGQRL